MAYCHGKLLDHKHHCFGTFALLTTFPATYAPDSWNMSKVSPLNKNRNVPEIRRTFSSFFPWCKNMDSCKQ